MAYSCRGPLLNWESAWFANQFDTSFLPLEYIEPEGRFEFKAFDGVMDEMGLAVHSPCS
jgi:hypothetical protein